MRTGYFWRGLSGKLLILTIVFVMLAEIILFIPSAALFRQNWLQERVGAAQQLTLAVMGVPDFKGSKLLNESFMDDTNVTAVMQKKEGMTESVLGMAPAGAVYTKVDLRNPGRLPDIGATLKTYFSDGSGYMRVIGEPSVPGTQMLEVIVPNAALKQALVDFGHRIIALSALIAIFTGLLIYLALRWLIVRPLQRLALAHHDFSEDPERLAGNIIASTRKDEIGILEREFIDMKADIRGALKQKDRLATLGLAVAKINHDLRNVLTSAQLISDRLATDSEERVRRMGERLVRAVDRGVQLCAATLSYSKSDEAEPNVQTIRLASLLGEAAGDAIAAARGQAIVGWVNEVPTDMLVMADPDQTYRIFNNLFRNAVQAMAGHDNDLAPALRVDAKPIAIEDDAGKPAGQDIIIRVIDNGPGLSADAQKSLFKPFTGTARGGTGLGLTISRELAVAHGGDLRMETTSEAGTVFAVVLPGAAAK